MEKYYNDHLIFFPKQTIKLILLLVLIFIGLFFMKEGKHRANIVSIGYCGIGFLIINLLVFFIVVVFSLINKDCLMHKYKILCKVHAIYKPIITIRLDRRSIN